MKLLTVALFCFFAVVKTHGQAPFEAGYIINNELERTDCLIRNVDWQNNPEEFEYRLSDTAPIQVGRISEIQEFGVENFSRYVRFEVGIDLSSDKPDELTDQRNPVFTQKQLFLKTLLSGDASLYYYEDGGLRRIFLETADGQIRQLVNRAYRQSSGNLAINEYFRVQLTEALKCPSGENRRAKNLRYSAQNISNFVKEYFICNDLQFVDFSNLGTQATFHLGVKPGIRFYSLEIDDNIFQLYDTKIEGELSYRIGLDLELRLPFNRGKWAIVFEPTYQQYQASTITEGIREFEIDYSSIELPIGARYYAYINPNKLSLFFNGFFILDADLGSSFNVDFLELNSTLNLAAGVGMQVNDRYSLEIRYATGRELIDNRSDFITNYGGIDILAGIRIF